MKLTINTEKFKDMVGRSIKGAGNDKTVPITQFMGITKKGKALTLTTTDATNYLYISDEVDKKQDDMHVTVFVEQFSKLISKITSETISLEVADNVLTVKGNGEYSIELPLDENGEAVIYPDPASEVFGKAKADVSGTVNLSDIKTILDTVKPSLASESDKHPEILNYFISNNVVMATDTFKIASFNVNLLDMECLVPPEVFNLFAVISDSSVAYKIVANSILFESGDTKIYGRLLDEAYPVDTLEKLLSEKFPSVCKINKADFLSLLDRISLFVTKYDEKTIHMSFEKDGIHVSNKAGKSVEVIEYQSSKKHKDFECLIDVGFLIEQAKAYASDVIELHYGRENSVKFIDGAITQVLALNIE